MNPDLKHCSTCKHYSKGYCDIKRFKVSINANFCGDYKERLINRIRNYLKNVL